MNWEAWKPLAVLIFTSLLKMAGAALVTHGLVQQGPGLEALSGAAMAGGASFWSWWVQKGHLAFGDYLKKLTDTATTAAAVAVAKKMAPAAVTGAATDARQKVAADTGTTVPRAPIIMFAAAAIALFLVFSNGAQAQVKLVKPTGNIVNDIQSATGNAPTPATATATAKGTKLGESGCSATGDPIADLHCVIKAGGAKLILHLKQSYALASAPGSITGSTTDNTSATCTKALVPIVDLVVNGPKSGTVAAPDPMALTTDEVAAAADPAAIDGPIVVIEKIRILRLAIQSPALNDACGALVQDEVKNAQSLVGKVTSLITGAGILAPLGL